MLPDASGHLLFIPIPGSIRPRPRANPIKHERANISHFSFRAIQAYYTLRRSPKDRRSPTRILLLGHGGSGKTHVAQHVLALHTELEAQKRGSLHLNISILPSASSAIVNAGPEGGDAATLP